MCLLIYSIHQKYEIDGKQRYIWAGTMKAEIFLSQTSLVVSNDFFLKSINTLKRRRYADVSRNSFRILPTVTKYNYFCWYLYTVEIANRCPRSFLHCTMIFVIALFNPFYRDSTIGHGVRVVLESDFQACLAFLESQPAIQNDYVDTDLCWESLTSTHWGRVKHMCVGNLTIVGQIMACRLAGAKP